MTMIVKETLKTVIDDREKRNRIRRSDDHDQEIARERNRQYQASSRARRSLSEEPLKERRAE